MSNITDWSPESGSEFNNAAPPNGAPEGMPPSAVNDVMREIMAAVRRQWQQAEWFEYGHEITRTSGTSFNIVGDQRAIYTVGRRVRVRGLATGTLLGTITNSVYSVITSVTIVPDSGTISNEPITVEVGINDPTQPSINAQSVSGLDALLQEITDQFDELNASNLVSGTVPRARLPAATTSAVGGVQLNNSTSSTSTTQAATANAVRLAAGMGSNRVGNRSARSINTNYTAATDGFIISTVYQNGNACQGVEILINGSVVARQSNSSEGWQGHSCIAYPVAQGEVYQARRYDRWGSGRVNDVVTQWRPLS